MIARITVIKKSMLSLLTLSFVAIPLTLIQSSQAATPVTADTKATATIASSCQISAQNLAFGNLVLPLSAQSASTSMNVLCSNKASYTVGLAYGGIYGSGGGATVNGITCYKFVGVNQQSGLNVFDVYNASGTQVAVVNQAAANGFILSGSIQPADPTTGCYSPLPAGTSLTYGEPGVVSTINAYAYGKMTGVANGDSIAYSIQVPGQSSQIWNTGNSSYSATGTGANQSIPVVGKLIPAQSGSSYPTPDMYMDTVTATVNF
jgi:spore coat protein U-like protein